MHRLVQGAHLSRLQPVREHLGIKPGTAVAFVLDAEGRVQLVKVGGRPPASRFARARGRATAGLSTDQIMALMRGED